MIRHECAYCAETHGEVEPTFLRPDDFARMSQDQRERLATADDDLCVIRDERDGKTRCFVRALIPFEVEGRPEPMRWGVWAEVSVTDFEVILALWRDANQSSHPPIPAKLANQIPGYESTMGLDYALSLTGAHTRPILLPIAGQEHAFVREFYSGVDEARVNSWKDLTFGGAAA